MITPTKVVRCSHKVDAFKTAQVLEPGANREKVSGFVLLVGSGPSVVMAGDDREQAVAQAVKILEKTDTSVILSKLQSRIGENLVAKDQLSFTRKQ